VKTVTSEIALLNILKYLKSSTSTPYIVVVDDAVEYNELVDELDTLAKIYVSDYCASDDSFPDYDALFNAITCTTKNTLLLGFGESVYLSGNMNFTSLMKDLSIISKVVILCRGIREAIKMLCSEDIKFNTTRRVCFLKSGLTYDVINFPVTLDVIAVVGVKALFKQLENGAAGTLFVKTTLPLKFIKNVDTAYRAIMVVRPSFPISESCLSDTLWKEYLADNSLEGYGLFHWRTYLKMKFEEPKDPYLKYVVAKSDSYDRYKKVIYTALLDFSPSDKIFSRIYEARKSLLNGVKDSEVAEYVAETKVKDNERIYYLTNNTQIERKAIIESLDGAATIPSSLEIIYPALAEYMHDYVFNGINADLLTSYFSEYKQQKLTNRLSAEFHQRVLDLAVDGSRPYNSLKTKGEVLDSINKHDTFLYWIDALGSEYIGYIQSRAKTLGLKISVNVVRANLPTITSQNNDFFETWCGKKAQTKKLDEVKHHGEHDYNYEITKLPIYLALELDIIDEFLVWAVSQLTSKNTSKVLLVSDHGASRLAVINENECKWEMVSKGKHSGRCCPCNEADVKSEYATQENGFWVLANYDRFKGGRKASVEVHGGATLEEVVIPIIEIELFDKKISISNKTPITTTSFKKNAEIILFSINALNNVSVRVNGKQYIAESIGNNQYNIIFSDIKKAGTYSAEVFEGDNLIGLVEFEVERESGKANDKNWF
jgi:hypothetical protein